MATANLQGEPRHVDTIFVLLESSDRYVFEDIRKLILENLQTSRESWLVHTLVDYYYVTHSARVEGILAEVREPQDKYLIDKLQDGLRNSDHRLPALKLLLYLVHKQQPWTHKLVELSIFNVIIKCLKSEIDIPVLMTALMIVAIILPVVPVTIAPHLNDIFEIFSRLVSFSVKKPANTPDVFLLHLQVALYSIFHRLYGMYPWHFLSYLRHQFIKKDNQQLYEEIILPMLERVRLHPHLVTGNRETEISTFRWKKMETQDVIVECAKLSLDLTEGTWEELKCPVFANRFQATQALLRKTHQEQNNTQDQEEKREFHRMGSDGVSDFLGLPGINTEVSMMCSPSVIIGLSTPPTSQRTTPATSFLDINALPPSLASTFANTPFITPDGTPRETPTIGEDGERAISRTSSRGSLLQKSDQKRVSVGNMPSIRVGPVLPDFKLTPGSQPSSVPPSPLKAEFTSEPPKGTFKSLPVRTANRALRFDPISEVQNISSLTHTEQESNKEVRIEGPVGPDVEETSSASESVSIDNLQHVIQGLHNEEEEDTYDPEVSELTKDSGLSENRNAYDRSDNQLQTAESVIQFMKKVNRIRFNSLTSNGNAEQSVVVTEKRGMRYRSMSCPPLKQDDYFVDEQDNASRPVSTTFENIQSESSFEGCGERSSENIKTRSMSNQSSEQTVKFEIDENSETKAQSSECNPNESGSSVVQEQPACGDTFNIISVLQTLLAPGKVSVCQNCRNQFIVTGDWADGRSDVTMKSEGIEIPMFSTLSPPELLDRHLKMGGDLHAKELTKIPLTSKESVNWTHFGGVPPADEVNILRGQILLLHNQVLYERHKRELHAKRNRRLLRKIANASSLEEQNKSMAQQLHMMDNKIKHQEVSLKLLQSENQQLNQTKESNEYLKICQFKSTLQENEDLRMANTELKSLLITQREDHDKLKLRLQEADSKLFHADKELAMLKEQLKLSQKVKEQVFHLQTEVLLMGELHQKYQEKLQVLHSQQNSPPEQDFVIMSLKSEVKSLKAQLEKMRVPYDSCKAKISELEDSVKNKDIALRDLKRNFEVVKISHENKLKAMDDKYHMMVRLNQQLEGQVIHLFGENDQLQQKTQFQAQAVAAATLRQSSVQQECRSKSVPPDTVVEGHTPFVGDKSSPFGKTAKDSGKETLRHRNAHNPLGMDRYSVAEMEHTRRENPVSQGYDSVSVTSQDLATDFRSRSLLYTDSEDNKSYSSSKTTDSGWWEKSTK